MAVENSAGERVGALYTLVEVAEILRMNERTVREQLIKPGELPAVRIGHRWLIAEEDLLDFLERHRSGNVKAVSLAALRADVRRYRCKTERG